MKTKNEIQEQLDHAEDVINRGVHVKGWMRGVVDTLRWVLGHGEPPFKLRE